MSKLVGYVWFSGRTVVGIVLRYDELGKEFKAYICAVNGISEEHDVQYISDWGTAFPSEEAGSLIEVYGTVVDKELLNTNNGDDSDKDGN